jgi:hypothetical protein
VKPPHKKAQREKEFRKNLERQSELHRQQRALGYIELEKPIRHGWFKTIELTASVEQYKNRNAIKEVFKKIITSYWGATKEKARQCWDQDRSRYMLAKDKPTISRKSYSQLSDQGKDLCVFFRYKHPITRKYHGRFYVNLPVGCFKIKFKRSYITHRRIIDPEIEAELDWLRSQWMKPGFFELSSRGRWNHWGRMIQSFEKKVEAHRVKEKLNRMKGIVNHHYDYEIW